MATENVLHWYNTNLDSTIPCIRYSATIDATPDNNTQSNPQTNPHTNPQTNPQTNPCLLYTSDAADE